jgi:hypothetical protein
MLCGGVFACRANQHLTTVDLGFNTRTRQRALAAGRRNRQLALLRFAHDGLRQRVAGALFHGRRQRQQVVFIHVIQGDGGGDAGGRRSACRFYQTPPDACDPVAPAPRRL